MYAVIKTGGKQYKVSEGDIVKVEKLPAEPGEKVTLEEVLLINDENGTIKVGKPVIEGAKVIAEVLEQGKGKKIYVMKYKRRKNYRRKQGHRQPFTKIKIEKIEG
ncbi:50S ribosomal protein L21 [Thermosyntropha sp.]|uniref:50S ribosomal protein L21 n=1 Tax=Thermosyntropha sp. TaxID=2740820 RepID=UPI0025E69AD9|nr:50S ribosomal protein L21 [Thermosyntropha sp.]MBO8158713.1 50S ribosomal protein L21 [Thermosyntropha sp.]